MAGTSARSYGGWLAPLLLVAGCGHGVSSGAAASCVGPQLVALTPDHGPARSSVTLSVEWLRDGCHDTDMPSDERPRTDVPVYFSQRNQDAAVGTVSGSGSRYGGTLRFDVPTTARPGTAVLYLGREHQRIATFTVG